MNFTTHNSLDGWPGQLVVRVRERASADAQEATRNPMPFASCGSASLRHPDNKLSGPTKCRVAGYRHFTSPNPLPFTL
jgi:hypothetical protein